MITGGLVGHWRLNALYGTRDMSPSPNAGVPVGSLAAGTATGPDGTANSATEFDGVDDEIDFQPVTFSGNACVCAWLYRVPGYKGLCGGSSYGEGYWLYRETDNNIYVNWGNAHALQCAASVFPDNTWFHFALVRVGANSLLYLNGAYHSSVACTTNTSTLRTIGSVYLGNASRFKGSICDFRAYNRALSASEIASIYGPQSSKISSLGSGLIGHWALDARSGADDLTPYARGGTAYNNGVSVGTVAGPSGTPNAATVFDGTNGYIRVPFRYSDFGSTGTLSFWVKTASGNTNRGILQFASTLTSGGPFILAKLNDTTLSWYVNAGYRINQTIPIGMYAHIALVYNGSVWTAYQNGVAVGSYTGGNAVTSDYLYFGNGYNGYWAGSMCDVRVYSRALSAADVSSLYNLAPGARIGDLQRSVGVAGHWPLDYGYGTSDIGPGLNAGTGAGGVAGGMSPVGTGGTITTIVSGNGVYKVHTFTTAGSSTFTPPAGVSKVEVLVVGGGGGGGETIGGGGGGGGVVHNLAYAVTGSPITVTVGAGGAGGTGAGYPAGTKGADSVFGTITALGGGAGGGYNVNATGTGGSGGGRGAANGAGGANTAGQGCAGGISNNNANSGAGGGGAGTVGGTSSSGSCGAGGTGYLCAITGTPVWYAGGGGGGARIPSGGTAARGGVGGGGAGGTGIAATSGTVNTGGGGGGGGYTNTGDIQGAGGTGGSGIVVVRYAIGQDRRYHQGAAALFDGSDDYVLCGNGQTLQLTTAITMSAWVCQTAYGAYNVILAKHVASTDNRHFMLGIYTNGKIFMSVAGVTYGANTVTSLGVWYHVVGVYDGTAGTMDLYLNGAKDAVTKNTGVAATMPSTDIQTVIGGYGYPGTVVEKFNGLISDVRVYGRVLSQAEITRIYETCNPRVVLVGE